MCCNFPPRLIVSKIYFIYCVVSSVCLFLKLTMYFVQFLWSGLVRKECFNVQRYLSVTGCLEDGNRPTSFLSLFVNNSIALSPNITLSDKKSCVWRTVRPCNQCRTVLSTDLDTYNQTWKPGIIETSV